MSDEPLYCPSCGNEDCGTPGCPGWETDTLRYCEIHGSPEPCPHCTEDLRRRREARELKP